MPENELTPAIPRQASYKLQPLRFEALEQLSFDEWTDAGDSLLVIEGSLSWWLGDWWNYGENHYGEEHSQAAPVAVRTAKTIANAASICSRIPYARRREELSFSHHAEVAYLQDDELGDRWLQIAIDEQLSVRRLRDRIRMGIDAIDVDGEPEPDPTPPTPPETNQAEALLEAMDWTLPQQLVEAVSSDEQRRLRLRKFCAETVRTIDRMDARYKQAADSALDEVAELLEGVPARDATQTYVETMQAQYPTAEQMNNPSHLRLVDDE